MKILIYGLHFKPDLIGIGKYTGEMADWLHKNKYNIRVITAPHFYPEWKLDKNVSGFNYSNTPYLVCRCPIYVPSKPRSMTRLLHFLSFAITSIPILLRNLSWKPDIIIAIEPPFFIAPLTLFFSKLSKVKSILHIQDLEIDAAYSLNILKKGILHKIIFKIEKFILNRFDTITTISSGMEKVLIEKGIDKSKIHIFPNWTDIENIHPQIDNNYLKKRLKIDNNEKIILYAGNMGEKQNLEIILNVADQIQQKKINCTFIMVGEGSSKTRLINYSKKLSLNNIQFLPLLPSNDLGALLTLADIHLITQNKNISDYVLPSKLTNILSAGGVSIIAANSDTELSNLVYKHGIGYLIKPNSEDELLKAIITLLNNRLLREKISKNARKYAERYLSQDKILPEFESKLPVK